MVVVPALPRYRIRYDVDAVPYTDDFLPLPTQSEIGSCFSMLVRTYQRCSGVIADRRAILAARFSAMRRLHTMLINNSRSATSNEAIAAVIRLTLNDIFFMEDTNDLRLHVEGALEMARARGGLAVLASTGENLAKIVIVVDLVTAVILEAPASLSADEISEFTRFVNNNNTIAATAPAPAHQISPFETTASPPLDPATAAMLKDMDFLLTTLLAQPLDDFSTWQTCKLQTTLDWVEGRISATPDAPSPFSLNTLTSAYTEELAALLLHRAVRFSSLLYCHAIRARRPFSWAAAAAAAQEGAGRGDGATVRAVAEAVRRMAPEVWWDLDSHFGGGPGGSVLQILVSILAVVLPSSISASSPSSVAGDHGCNAARAICVAAAVELALVDWGVAVRVLGRVIELQAWLRRFSQQG